MKKVIFNADDFGLHPEVNAGIIRAYEHGVLTSTSVMAVGAALTEAAELLHSHPDLDTSVHITLVAEKPVLPAAEIPSLVTEEGLFLPDYGAFMRRYVCGGISMAEVRAECEAQIVRLEELGIHPSHLDSHQHLHVLPGIIEICLDLMEQHGITRLRIPAESYGFTGGYHAGMFRRVARDGLTFFAERARRKARALGFRMPDHFYGMLSGGHTGETNLLRLLRAIVASPGETFEIMQHPGHTTPELAAKYPWGYHWSQERDALCSPAVREFLHDYDLQPTAFRDL
ncbi:MAG TPA: hypothetical protein DEA67_08750 [Selenomonas sp.]|nr:hypothetical protein [Selenomonas sp.]